MSKQLKYNKILCKGTILYVIILSNLNKTIKLDHQVKLTSENLVWLFFVAKSLILDAQVCIIEFIRKTLNCIHIGIIFYFRKQDMHMVYFIQKKSLNIVQIVAKHFVSLIDS